MSYSFSSVAIQTVSWSNAWSLLVKQNPGTSSAHITTASVALQQKKSKPKCWRVVSLHKLHWKTPGSEKFYYTPFPVRIPSFLSQQRRKELPTAVLTWMIQWHEVARCAVRRRRLDSASHRCCRPTDAGFRTSRPHSSEWSVWRIVSAICKQQFNRRTPLHKYFLQVRKYSSVRLWSFLFPWNTKHKEAYHTASGTDLHMHLRLSHLKLHNTMPNVVELSFSCGTHSKSSGFPFAHQMRVHRAIAKISFCDVTIGV